jgi:hypothetical protein
MDQRSPGKKSFKPWCGAALLTGCLAGLLHSACSSGPKYTVRHPISNPFPIEWGYEGRNVAKESVVLRTKKGDRAVEVEFPGDPGAFSDFVVPVSPAFSDGHPLRTRGDDYADDGEGSWRDIKPTYSDREITSSFPKGPAASGQRRDLEDELGVLPPENPEPVRESSYLAALDHVKRLFRNGRYENALTQVDELLTLYPTDPRLHQMRGTLLDRTGQPDLAMRSWAEAIELDPANMGLKKFVDRRRAVRTLGSRQPATAPAPAVAPSTSSPGTMPTEGVKP